MKSLLSLTKLVTQECGTWCGADPSRDLLTIARRVEHEGDSFLTITLPRFCQEFERALETGRLDPSSTPSFRWSKKGLPAFLRGFLIKVFHEDGRLRDNASPEAVRCVRQICLLHKKVKDECSDARKKAAELAYIACEHELERSDAELAQNPYYGAFKQVSAKVWADVFRGIPSRDLYELIHPIHGPGATAERVLGNAKWAQRRWHQRLEEEFPYSEFAVASVRNIEARHFEDVQFVEPEDEEPVRVIFVPKTQKTPRVIAIEPVCMQYMQQGILRVLVPLIEKGRLTKGHVNFTDQSINQQLALASSRDGRLATIDMSEASDRVSLKLVEDMLATLPAFRRQVMACRSRRAKLPSGDILTMKKFASMGSALCFPMEAMAFYCAIIAIRCVKLGLQPSLHVIDKLSRDVYVYGDDILVPTHEAPGISADLSLFGFKVNKHKSFWTGKFRESCGLDAFDGERVTPVYARQRAPADTRNVEALIGWVAMSDQFYESGMWQTADAIRKHIEDILGLLPVRSVPMGDLHFRCFQTVNRCDWRFHNPLFDRADTLAVKQDYKHYAYNLHGRYIWSDKVKDTVRTRRKPGLYWQKDLHQALQLGWTPVVKYKSDVIDDDAALLKCFALIGGEHSETLHLQRSVARGALTLRRRKVLLSDDVVITQGAA